MNRVQLPLHHILRQIRWISYSFSSRWYYYFAWMYPQPAATWPMKSAASEPWWLSELLDILASIIIPSQWLSAVCAGPRRKCSPATLFKRGMDVGGIRDVFDSRTVYIINPFTDNSIVVAVACWIRLHVQSSTLITSLRAEYIIHGSWAPGREDSERTRLEESFHCDLR